MSAGTAGHRGTHRLRAGAVAALLAAGLAPPSASAGTRVAERDIAGLFSGVTLDGIYRNGALFTETYNTDGSLRYHDMDGADSGQWSVKQDRFCTFYERQEGACFHVERDGDNCFTFFIATARGEEDRSASRDWTSRGWDRAKPATCPTAPEIQL
jgi:hypothetical protein